MAEVNDVINGVDTPTGMIMDAVSIPEETKNSVAATTAAVGDMRSAAQVSAQQYQPRKMPPLVRKHPKIRRNEPCPCGSGKKYKNCCLDSGKYEGYHYQGVEEAVEE